MSSTAVNADSGARRRGPPRGRRKEVVELPGVEGGHGDELLCEHVQRVRRDPQRLDGAGPHPLGHHGGLDEIAAVLGEDHTGGHCADLVSRAAHALQTGGHGGRRLDLDDQVHRTHVDAQLEAGGGDDGGQPARLEVLLDDGPLLLGDRAVVGAREHRGRALRRTRAAHQLCRRVVLLQRLSGRPLVRDLVEPVAQPLRETAGVGEHDRGAVGLDQVRDPFLDVRPDGGALLALAAVADGGAAQLAQVLDGNDDRQVELFAGLGLDDLHLAAGGEEAGHLVHRAHGGGQADAAGGPGQQLVEPLQRERQMGAALGARHGVHLVQNHRLHAGQRVARGGRQHQEERLGRGDQDVRRARGQRPAVGGRGVARADPHLHLRLGQAEPHRLLADPRERTAQVSLHVDREGLKRGHVQHAAAFPGVGGRRHGGQLVERGEERGQRLAGAGRGDHQHVRTLADGAPRPGLGRGGRGERPREPVAGRGGEAVEGRMRGTGHASILHPSTDNHSDLRKRGA